MKLPFLISCEARIPALGRIPKHWSSIVSKSRYAPWSLYSYKKKEPCIHMALSHKNSLLTSAVFDAQSISKVSSAIAGSETISRS